MKIGDLVKRRSTGKIDIVTKVLMCPGRTGFWVRLADKRAGVHWGPDYEVISESG